MSPFQSKTKRALSSRRRSSMFASRSRSPAESPPYTPSRSLSRKKCSKPVWQQQMRALPIEHSKFIWNTVSYITSLQAFFDFAAGCDLPIHIVRRAIEDNDPSDGEVSLGNCVAQALVIWWLSSNRPAIWKSIHSCLMKRHPTLDSDTQNNNNQSEPQPGPSGQMSKKPDKYQTIEYIVFHLKSFEFDFSKNCLD